MLGLGDGEEPFEPSKAECVASQQRSEGAQELSSERGRATTAGNPLFTLATASISAKEACCRSRGASSASQKVASSEANCGVG